MKNPKIFIAFMFWFLILASCGTQNQPQRNTTSQQAQIVTNEDVSSGTASGEIDVNDENVEETVLETTTSTGTDIFINSLEDGSSIEPGELIIWNVSASWYSKESSFPIMLLDTQGNIITETSATWEVIDEEWNPTWESVQFIAELNFEKMEWITAGILRFQSATDGEDKYDLPITFD